MSAKASLFYLLLFLLFPAGCLPQDKKQIIENEDGVPVASMADAGIDPSMINKIDTAIRNGTYPNIHSLLIARNNLLVYEKYWPGKDEHWGDDLGIAIHAKDSLHDIRSISKSIVSACIGIAIQQGKIKSVDQKIFDFFPEYAKQDTGLKSLLTIKHLLTMSSGLLWNEEVPYDDPENSEVKMIRSPNPVEYVLSQPMESPPGKVWKYNGGTTQLLAAIIEKTSGKKIDQFAKEYLFQPLGITRFEWVKYPGTDLPAAASGLRLRSRDLLKFGLLYNNNGKWKDKQVVPAKWVQESFQAQVQRGGGAYGYQFWLWHDTIRNKPISMVACVGNGDQRIFFDKTRNLIVVVTAGNYNKWDIEKNAGALLKDYIYPALIKE
ncbi:MAG TPA: serine hydrolase [Chitinophagaceae bacterium]|jgi:CubicO group peptidase (beta-lactamase class C family)